MRTPYSVVLRMTYNLRYLLRGTGMKQSEATFDCSSPPDVNCLRAGVEITP